MDIPLLYSLDIDVMLELTVRQTLNKVIYFLHSTGALCGTCLIVFSSVILLLFLTTAVRADDKTIEICTPEWEFYTESDGGGLYHELWRKVYEAAGYELDIHYAPFARCLLGFGPDAINSPFDTYAAGYPQEGVIHPKWHLGLDVLTVVYRAREHQSWHGQEILRDKRVGWLRGYNFDGNKIITVPVKRQPINQLSSGLGMLALGRIDFLIDYQPEISSVIRKNDLDDKLSTFDNVMKGRTYYMIFNPSARSNELIRIWDEEMQRLSDSGELHRLFENYEDDAY